MDEDDADIQEAPWDDKDCSSKTPGEEEETPPSRDHICECLARQSELIGSSVHALASAVATAVMDQGKQLGKVISRLERVARDQMRKQDALITDVLQHLASTGRSQVAENGIRINLVREQLQGAAKPVPEQGGGAAKPAANEPAPDIGEPPPGEEELPPPTEPQKSAKQPEKEKEKKPDDEGEVCGPIKPPSAGDKGTTIFVPWGKERGSKAGLFSDWGQIQLDEARSHYEPAGPFIQAFCQPDPPNAIMELAKKKRKRWNRPDDGPKE